MKYYTTSKISENMHETPEGFLLCIGVPIARTGEMIYGEGETPLETDDSGKIKIHRDASEVFRPETIASFEGKAVTITHPTEFVGPQNWSRLAKGTLQNVRRGEGEQKDDLIADLLIMDHMAINLIKNGLREVSCGYEADYTQTEEGKGTQTNIVGNHLALVDQGRAGSAYAINDHKGESKMKLSEKIKAIFAKAQDEAMKAASDESSEKPPEKKDEKAKDEVAYDELVKICKDVLGKLEGMTKQKDAASPAEGAQGEKDKPAAKDEEVATGLEDRLKALEASVAKLLEMEAAEAGDEDKEDDKDKAKDAEEEESEDDDFEESTMTGDTASRAEILAPGIKKTKDVKSEALKAAYGTKEGKKVIDALTGGKAPTYDSAEKVDTLFIAASELLKVSRNSDFSKSKQTKDFDSGTSEDTIMTPEMMNKKNAEYYKRN